MSVRDCDHRGGNARGQRAWRSAFHGDLQGADARQHRRRLWRHRHQPALRVARSAWSPPAATAAAAAPQAVLGVLSLILWALIVVVTLKYVVFLLRADNNGEGGTLALMALAQRAVGKGGGRDRAARHHLRRAVLRRRGHHAGALGAVGGRGHQARHADLRALCRAADGRHPGGAVCRAVARHRAGRGVFGPVMLRLVRRHRGRGRAAHRATSRSAAGAQSALCRLASCSITA